MNIAVFASGRGSNFEAILDAIDRGRLSARVAVLLSNKSDAGARAIALAHNISSIHLSQKQFAGEDAFTAAMLEILRNNRIDFIALAGYLKRVPAEVIRQFRNRILNIHPALLPAFGGSGMYGHYVHEAVIASGAKVTGATVHIVDEEFDHGPIVMQECVRVAEDDTPDSLAAKVLQLEHELFPRALQAFARGKVRVEGRRAWVTS